MGITYLSLTEQLNAESINKKTQDKLDKYEELYNKQNKKALITTI